KIEAERENALQQKLESNPEKVTTTSSMTPIFDPKPRNTEAHNESGDELDMLRGLKSDLRTVKETFQLSEVPKEVLYIGFGGLVPYLGTSLSTLYLAWDINYSQENGMGYLISEETAGHLLHILEPLQVGLGAVILSFLGAVHWGLEMAEYGGKHSYKRYSLSILAPVIAWPTLLLPVNIALIAQFVGFTGMYFADSTATSKGWAPRWYMTYRFLLTFVVGASIVMTLVGRGQIGDRVSKLPGPAAYLQDLRDSQWENLQKEENERKMRVTREKIEEAEAQKEQDAADEEENDANGNDKSNKDDKDDKDNK
ncbi:hypothetical protein P167DRAFT_457638, partial [Morchella conica CCBAS932]